MTPECIGSGLVLSPGDRVTVCPHCRHHVRVVNGVVAKHWWSQRMKRGGYAE